MHLDAQNKLRPIAYTSQTLKPAELNYSITHKEVLTAVWTLQHFKDLIYGHPIHVKTDHTAITELFNSKHLIGKLARWSLIVQDFNPSFSYLPGKANLVTDALWRHIGTLQISEGKNYKSVLAKEQRANPFCSPLLYYLEFSDDTHLPHLVPQTEFDFIDEIFVCTTYLEAKYEPDREVTQIMVPKTLAPTITEWLHSAPQAGHPRKDRCLHQARLEYYWPIMHKVINAYADVCHTCAINKGSVSKPVPILSYPTPLQPRDT